jgi:hypothetical protein
MFFQGFNQGNDPGGQPRSRVRLVLGNVVPYLPQPRQGPRRPDDLYWHNVSSSCCLPQAHFGGGSSRSVPHESSHAFMSSCVT